MKKTLTIIILTLFFLATAGTVFAEEMAKEGSTSGKTYLTGTFKVLPLGKEFLQMNYEGTGIGIDDSGKGILHNAAIHILGALRAVKGTIEETGSMVITPPEGGKVYANYKATGTLGKDAKGTWTYVGGTEKFVGIEGGGEFTRYPLQNATEGMWTALSLTKGNYKLP